MKASTKILTHSTVIGPLMLAGVLPAAAGQATFGFGSGSVPIQLVGNDTQADRDTYAQHAQNDMQDWQQKLRAFGDKVDAKGQTAADAIKVDLNHAWTRAEAASQTLQTASAADWQSAKISYEKASRDLSSEWDKIGAEDK